MFSPGETCSYALVHHDYLRLLENAGIFSPQLSCSLPVSHLITILWLLTFFVPGSQLFLCKEVFVVIISVFLEVQLNRFKLERIFCCRYMRIKIRSRFGKWGCSDIKLSVYWGKVSDGFCCWLWSKFRFTSENRKYTPNYSYLGCIH